MGAGVWKGWELEQCSLDNLSDSIVHTADSVPGRLTSTPVNLAHLWKQKSICAAAYPSSDWSRLFPSCQNMMRNRGHCIFSVSVNICFPTGFQLGLLIDRSCQVLFLLIGIGQWVQRSGGMKDNIPASCTLFISHIFVCFRASVMMRIQNLTINFSHKHAFAAHTYFSKLLILIVFTIQ